jgi:hypothetical protein
MSLIDLRKSEEDRSRGGTHVRRFGDHDNHGIEISLGHGSVHVMLQVVGLTFCVDNDDLPSALVPAVNPLALTEELKRTIVKRLNVEALEEMFREFRWAIERAHRDGEHDARMKMREAIGL